MKQLSVLLVLLFLYSIPAHPQTKSNDNRMIIVTMDGMRWQEVFKGAEESIMRNKKYMPKDQNVSEYAGRTPQDKREKLLPFFWDQIATHGQLYGNRDLKSFVNCSNPYWFSYPGYHELFVGAVDKKVCSNVKIQNPNSTVLEFLNSQITLKNSIATFSTWDAFPYILRESRSGIIVNAGLEPTGDGEVLTQNELLLNARLKETHDRTDSITFNMAFEYLKKNRPHVLYLALDGTDHYAHGARYDLYLNAAHEADTMLQTLWTWLQNDPEYHGRTTLLITTDHGRGHTLAKSWRHHGRLTFGSGQIWMAVLGPEIEAAGEVKGGPQIYQKQIASTIAEILGFHYSNNFIVGSPISTVIQPPMLIAETNVIH